MDADLLACFAGRLKTLGFRSWKLYERAARRFLEWLSARQVPLAEADAAILHEYLCHHRRPHHRPATVKAELERLRVLFRYAIERNPAAGDPTRGVSHRWLDVPGGLPAYRGVLRRIFRRPHDLLRFRLPLFAPHWEDYLASRLETGYCKKGLLPVMEYNAHFHRYLAGEGVRRLERIRPRHVEAFLRREGMRFLREHGRPITAKYLGMMRNWIEGFLSYAFKQRGRHFRKQRSPRRSRVLPPELLASYLEFCRADRGLRPATLKAYLWTLSRLGPFLDRRGIRAVRDVSLADLDAFLLRHGGHMGVRGLQAMASGLRSLFRFLYLDGRIPRDLAPQVLVPRRYKADLRPKYLPWRKVRVLLASVDRSRRSGKRDYAILMLLACHGLRAREAAGLRMEDIDFAGRSLLLRRSKTGSPARIPISEEAAAALREHLAAREALAPWASAYREVFLSERAPIRPLSSFALCSMVDRRVRQRFGRLTRPRGAYMLRHSFAKALLDRGAKLHEIGALLRHKSLRSTLIYTRIATEDLREVADNYAEWLL